MTAAVADFASAEGTTTASIPSINDEINIFFIILSLVRSPAQSGCSYDAPDRWAVDLLSAKLCKCMDLLLVDVDRNSGKCHAAQGGV